MFSKIVVFVITYGFINGNQCVSDDNAEKNFASLTEVQAHFNNVEQSRNSATLYLTSYLPAAMQAMAYYIDQLQYTQAPLPAQDQASSARPTRPTTRPTQKTTTTGRTTTSRTTTSRTTTRRASTVSPIETTTPKHKPGNYSPERPPKPSLVAVAQNTQWNSPTRRSTTTKKPTWWSAVTTQRTTTKKQTWWSAAAVTTKRTTARPSNNNQQGVVNIVDDDKKQFFTWFFKPQAKKVSLISVEEYDLQLLDPLPKDLLIDINDENFEPPARLDNDNLIEFRKKYDDSVKYGVRQTLSGRKRVPPTEPYVKMLLLYDLLKREAKVLMLNKYSGYSKEMLDDLRIVSKYRSVEQLHYLLKKMLDRKDTTRSDIIERTNSILTDLENPKSVSVKAISEIPALKFCETDDDC